MNTHSLTLFTLLTLLLFTPPVFASDEGFTILQTWAPNQGTCTGENTTTVILTDLLENPESYFGTCIRTEGYYRARTLFPKKRYMRKKYAHSNHKNFDKKLGIYASDTQMERLDGRRRQRVTVSGMVSDCSALTQKNTVMVMGYCHYTTGPIIGLSPE